ncbi:hypothetical protein R2083_12840 [Nitrosomonas sp. Is35]|uniref:hypothetical protein n=1 Tax=unclassified Nitrosomonas TaxID=2609265 RepID=UPI00294B2552|nr:MULTISPECIES: hypothetical protein [unclassified Nitrosomonas]MDV6342497.1 hypothetical protein [Nitrosomonas sp. Is24]MDV6348402.1 hypothetical protein [Nitrosomonas sp. Is35]
MKTKIFVLFFLMTTAMFAHANIGNTTTQQHCTSIGTESAPLPPNQDSTWANGGLNRSHDRQIYGVDIVAYKIKWSSGWSDWFVKGVNDLYAFSTPNSASPSDQDARLAWIYFYDHNFIAIYCQ